MTPTARSLKHLRDNGYLAEVVERTVPFARRKVDFLGIIDILAVKVGEPVLGVQTTTRSNQAARLKKALATPELETWLAAGCAFEIHGWALTGARGERKLWTLARRPLTLQEYRSRGDLRG